MIRVYTDGSISAKGNRKGNTKYPAGWAFVAVQDGKVVHEENGVVELDACKPGFLGSKYWTNNTAELTAIYWALTYLHMNAEGKGIVYSDSKYAIGAIKGEAAITANKQLVKLIRGLYFPYTERFKLRWIKGHAGYGFNERADELAKEATHEA